MNSVQFVLFGFTIVGFFGSLTYFMSTIPSDFMFLFREKKQKEYVAFLNRASGKVCFLGGVVSLVLLLASLLVQVNVDTKSIFVIFLLYFLIMRVLIELKWNRSL